MMKLFFSWDWPSPLLTYPVVTNHWVRNVKHQTTIWQPSTERILTSVLRSKVLVRKWTSSCPFFEISNHEKMACVKASILPSDSQHIYVENLHVVMSESAPNKHTSMKVKLQQSMLSTVHDAIPQTEWWRRNVIIEGLWSFPYSDEDLYSNLWVSEFDLQLDIVWCKHLSKLQEGMIKPLLVILSTVEQADKQIWLAKQQRDSCCPEMKKSVYIKPDLIKEEAREDYDRWCNARAR